jgi:hypothetical protein
MSRIVIVCLSVLLFCGVSYAQLPFGYGIKGGVGLTHDYSPESTGFGFSSSGRDYIVGPYVELRLPFGLGVEADALYRPVNVIDEPNQWFGGLAKGSYPSWEFPVLAKYRFRLPIPLIKPLIEAGPSFRIHAASLPNLTPAGFTAGGGVEFKVPLIRFSSEIRWTHWAAPSAIGAVSSPNANQAELLFGIGF